MNSHYMNAVAKHRRLFQQPVYDVEAEYSDLIYTEIRWLSRGGTLERFVNPSDEVKTFRESKNEVVDSFE